MDPTPQIDSVLPDTFEDLPQNVKPDEQQVTNPQNTQQAIRDGGDAQKIDLEDEPEVPESHEACSKIDPDVTLQPISDVIEELLIHNPAEPIPEPTPDKPPESSQPTYVDDNGIFDFMTPDRAIELFRRIHSEGIPTLDWKFYGRRRPGEQERDDSRETNGNNDESQIRESSQDQALDNTEFDFDVDEFSDLQADSTLINESLSLKKRPEPAKEKKTNLSDIMSDIMKESHLEDVDDV